MTFAQLLSAASDIPATRFLGQAPGGLNATGEGDQQNYYDMVSAYQRLHLMPAQRACIDWIGAHLFGGRAWREKSKELTIVYPPLKALSEKEEAEVANTYASMLKNLADSGVIRREDAAAELTARGLFRGEVQTPEGATEEETAADATAGREADEEKTKRAETPPHIINSGAAFDESKVNRDDIGRFAEKPGETSGHLKSADQKAKDKTTQSEAQPEATSATHETESQSPQDFVTGSGPEEAAEAKQDTSGSRDKKAHPYASKHYTGGANGYPIDHTPHSSSPYPVYTASTKKEILHVVKRVEAHLATKYPVLAKEKLPYELRGLSTKVETAAGLFYHRGILELGWAEFAERAMKGDIEATPDALKLLEEASEALEAAIAQEPVTPDIIEEICKSLPVYLKTKAEGDVVGMIIGVGVGTLSKNWLLTATAHGAASAAVSRKSRMQYTQNRFAYDLITTVFSHGLPITKEIGEKIRSTAKYYAEVTENTETVTSVLSNVAATFGGRIGTEFLQHKFRAFVSGKVGTRMVKFMIEKGTENVVEFSGDKLLEGLFVDPTLLQEEFKDFIEKEKETKGS